MRIKIIYFFLCLLSFINFCYANNYEEELKKIAITTNPSYFFEMDDFSYLGKVTKYDIAFNKHYWGNGRVSGRILVFKGKDLIGAYAGITEQPVIIGSKLFFSSIAPDVGNQIDFETEIPKRVYLDGETIFFETYTYNK